MRVLLAGSTGFVGQAVAAVLSGRGHVVVGACRSAAGPGDVAVDLAEAGAVAALVAARAPEAVVNVAAVPDIGPCKQDPDLARRLNADMPGALARACVARGVRLVHVSTDQVFDGRRPEGEDAWAGWTEDDEARPLHVYGRTKLAGERAVLQACPVAAVVRPALVTGPAPAGRRSCTTALLDALARGERPRMFTDEVRTPIPVDDLARALAELVERGDIAGLFHWGGPEGLTRYQLALREAEAAGLDPAAVGQGTRVEAGLQAERPADLSLDSSRLAGLLGWSPAGPVRTMPR